MYGKRKTSPSPSSTSLLGMRSPVVLFTTLHLLLAATTTKMVDGATEYTDRYQECPPENKTCTYYFKVQEKLTMIMHKDLVYPHQGKLYKYNEEPGDANPTEVSVSYSINRLRGIPMGYYCELVTVIILA